MSDTHFEVSRMTLEEITEALFWVAIEGWNPGLHDAPCFYQADPQGFFAGRVHGELAAIGAAVVYDEHYAFGGLYIVKPSYRYQGYGMQLTRTCLNYVGERSVGIDAVLEMAPKYAKFGCVPEYQTMCYEFPASRVAPAAAVQDVVDARELELSVLTAYDRRYFSAARPSFLRCWIRQPDGHALAYVKAGEILGFGAIRKCHQGYKIGPLFAETPEIAEVLLGSLSARIPETQVRLDVPVPNHAGVALAEKYKMKPVSAMVRMYRNGAPKIELEKVFGITTRELG